MGATSVTGVGLGSADGKNKGSSHMTLGVAHLIGPRCVIVDSATLDESGDLTVKLPLLPGVATDYVVLAGPATAAAHATGASITISNGVTTVVLKGTADDAVWFAVLKKGMAI